MENIVQRAGCIRVRTGGNTQEFARYANELPPSSNNSVVVKENVPGQNPTETPTLLYNLDYFYLLGNISALVNIGWFLGQLAWLLLRTGRQPISSLLDTMTGIPLDDTNVGVPIRLEVAEYGQQVLGDRLLGLQVGNEPDLYAAHNHRPPTYSPYDYFNEFGLVAEAIRTNPRIGPLTNNKLIGPSVATGAWTPEMVWDTGFIDSYGVKSGGMLGSLAVEHYPDDNCFALYGTPVGQPKDVQAIFSDFLNHTSAQSLVRPYLNSSSIAASAGLPLYMFETNTASCGGFPGISDSFGATLWLLDYGLQMAWGNFSGGLIHVGGRNVYYNPFTPPPTNESPVHQWTVGATYYSALVTAEIFGASNKSRIVDLQQISNPSIYQPQYAIYEGGQLARIALFNFVSDNGGSSDYTATLRLNGQIDRVYVKYLLSGSVSTKNNITWGGQTLGTKYTVDGRLRPSSPTIYTVICSPDDTSDKVCRIKVPAPSFALVSLPAFPPFPFIRDSSAIIEVKTFSTSTRTRTRNTATVNPSVLATSNGDKRQGELGSTSQANSAGRRFRVAGFAWWVVWWLISWW
ncbi:hypothetical protein PQX77_012070 [Marasmius sp. AFHP31]|nr:hypothetical protein PQX77_012070 [Marasmius sp. AFHP31]